MTGALTEKLSAARAGSRDHKFTDEERFAATRYHDSSESSPSHNLPSTRPEDPMNQAITKPSLISTTEIVERYGVTRKTLQRWLIAGKIVPVKTLTGRTGAHLFDEADIEAAFGSWKGHIAAAPKELAPLPEASPHEPDHHRAPSLTQS